MPTRPPYPAPRPRPASPVAQPRGVPAFPAPRPGDPLPAPQPGDERAPRILRIEFVGNNLYDTASIKVKLLNKEGSRLQRSALDRDMETLYTFFGEVVVKQVPVQGGIILRFIVSENPIVVELTIRGTAELEEEQIRGVMRTKQRFPLSRYQLAADIEDILEMYRMQGFHFAHIPEPQITSVTGGGRRIVLTIVEGERVLVRKVQFRGNDHVPRKDLLEVMQTKPPDLLQGIFGSPQPYREHGLQEDLVAIAEYYRGKGYLDAEVVLEDRRFSDQKNEVELTIRVIEHQRYRVGRISFEIERLDAGDVAAPPLGDQQWFSKGRLEAWLGIRAGDPYDGEVIKEGLEKIKEEYYARSYLEVDIRGPTWRGYERENLVDLEFKVIEGPKLRLARVDFYGNEYTRDRILRREVKLSPGGPIDRTELDRGRARLRRTGWFDRVDLRIDDAIGPDGQEMPGWKTATYQIVEGRTGQFNFGAGISTDGGVFGNASYTKRNFDITKWPRNLSFKELTSRRTFTGAGQIFNLNISPGTETTQFSVRFTEPRVFDTKLSFTVRLRKNLRFREDYEVDRTGYELSLGYPLIETVDDTASLTAQLGWTHEWWDIQEIEFGAVPGALLFDDERELRLLFGQLASVHRDDIRNTRWQMRNTGRLELAGTFLGGELDFWKASFDHEQMWVIHEDSEGKKHRFVAKAGVSYAEALEDTSEVPPYLRFYRGGRNLRGFQFRGVGPHINGNPTGGEFALAGSGEYELPLIARTLSLVAFADWGIVSTNAATADLDKLRLTLGAGFRLVIPVFGNRPLAFDFGIPVLYEDEDQRSIFSFSLGRSF